MRIDEADEATTVATCTGTIRGGLVIVLPTVAGSSVGAALRSQARNRLSLIWCDIATAAMDAPGCWHCVTSIALKALECVRLWRNGGDIVHSVHQKLMDTMLLKLECPIQRGTAERLQLRLHFLPSIVVAWTDLVWTLSPEKVIAFLAKLNSEC